VGDFQEKFKSEEYENDEPVWLDCIPEGAEPDYNKGLNVPERIFGRIQAIAKAYDLHLLSALNPNQQTRLNSLQSAGLERELRSIGSTRFSFIDFFS
jgi:hypothetical protein